MEPRYHFQPVTKKQAQTVDGLTYFTHEVDGRLYGGWYRRAADAASVELYARGKVRKAKIGRASAEDKARRLMEDIVHSLPAPRASEH
ncbi:MAG TPA: hypothetical protein VJ011_07250 [Steroidobacteraceae bacterium]|nr:hypothetical protein [Steroidobacteraceae bacterium]